MLVSTIAMLMCGIYKVDSGNIFYNGTNINTLNLNALRLSIGIVNQELHCLLCLLKTISNMVQQMII